MGKRIGAPTKLTYRRAKRIADAVSIGTPLTAAARYGGVTYQTFTNWHGKGQALTEAIETGEDPELDTQDKPYLYFFDKIEEAKAEAALQWSNVIYQEAQHSPAWAAWMLRHWYPEQFGEKTQLDLTSGGEALPISQIVDRVLRWPTRRWALSFRRDGAMSGLTQYDGGACRLDCVAGRPDVCHGAAGLKRFPRVGQGVLG